MYIHVYVYFNLQIRILAALAIKGRVNCRISKAQIGSSLEEIFSEFLFSNGHSKMDHLFRIYFCLSGFEKKLVQFTFAFHDFGTVGKLLFGKRECFSFNYSISTANKYGKIAEYHDITYCFTFYSLKPLVLKFPKI